ncbi:hypothetical protein [Actinacidiphila glaucinigra]
MRRTVAGGSAARRSAIGSGTRGVVFQEPASATLGPVARAGGGPGRAVL